MKKNQRRVQDAIAGYLFVAPPILGFLLFGLLPMGYSLVVSLSEFEPFEGTLTYVGFQNYRWIFNDPVFYKSLGNIGLALLGVLAQMVVMLAVAYLLTRDVKGVIAFRALFFVPSLCSSVAVTLVWKSMYQEDFGILNNFLLDLGLQKVQWLSSTKVAMVSMILQGIWMGIGGGMVMYISALKNVPSQYYEAAEIDGANALHKFFHITWHCVTPTTFYILITTVIGTISDFARFKLMTDGGPDNATLTPVLYVYQVAFSASYNYDYAYASATAWVVGFGIMAIIGLLFVTSKRWVYYND